jgi:hypothetical protein
MQKTNFRARMNADFQGSIKPKIFFRVYLRKSASNGTKKAEPSLTLPPCKSMPIFVSGPIKPGVPPKAEARRHREKRRLLYGVPYGFAP